MTDLALVGLTDIFYTEIGLTLVVGKKRRRRFLLRCVILLLVKRCPEREREMQLNFLQSHARRRLSDLCRKTSKKRDTERKE